jgi:serine/threonine protein kinase
MQDHEPLSCDIMCYTKDGKPWWRHMLAIPIVCGAFLTFNVNTTRKNRYVGQYLIGHNIGRGSFGTVKLGRNKKTGQVVALKRINDVSDPRTRKLVELEIEIQSHLKSDMICELFEVLKVDNMVFMVMAHCAGGSVFDKLVSKGGVSESRARAIFRQMVASVNFCHQNCVVHRDLKPENILLDEKLVKVSLIDFGLATYFTPGQVMRRATSRKAPGYDAPPIDVWSLAVILFELVHGQIRLSQSDSNSTAEFIEKYCAQQSQRGSFTQGLCDLLHQMLIIEPTERITCAAILEHPWLDSVGPDPTRTAVASPLKLMPTALKHVKSHSSDSCSSGGGMEPGFRSGTDGAAMQGESDWEALNKDQAGKQQTLRRKLGGTKLPKPSAVLRAAPAVGGRAGRAQ